MLRYDPDQPPDPTQWLALDEQLRIGLVEAHHQQARIELPNAKAHAVFHVIVENQIAENLAPVVRAMARLAAQGLSRHEAVHAIAAVAAEHMHDLLNARLDKDASPAAYDAAVEQITADRWQQRYGPRRVLRAARQRKSPTRR